MCPRGNLLSIRRRARLCSGAGRCWTIPALRLKPPAGPFSAGWTKVCKPQASLLPFPLACFLSLRSNKIRDVKSAVTPLQDTHRGSTLGCCVLAVCLYSTVCRLSAGEGKSLFCKHCSVMLITRDRLNGPTPVSCLCASFYVQTLKALKDIPGFSNS